MVKNFGQFSPLDSLLSNYTPLREYVKKDNLYSLGIVTFNQRAVPFTLFKKILTNETTMKRYLHPIVSDALECPISDFINALFVVHCWNKDLKSKPQPAIEDLVAEYQNE